MKRAFLIVLLAACTHNGEMRADRRADIAKPASTEASPPIDEIVRRINAGDAGGLRAMLTTEMQARIDDAAARKLVADALVLGSVRQTSWQGDDALTSLYILRCEHGDLRLLVRMEGAKIAYLAIERVSSAPCDASH
jgi:hypothetical protein